MSKDGRRYGQKVTIVPDGSGGYWLRLQVGRRTFLSEATFTRMRDAKAAGVEVAESLSTGLVKAPA